jgi:hypothetical protein
LTQAYTGARPTTSTIAGMVSGSRQMNSTNRRRPGSRNRTQIAVGTSRTSIRIAVSAACLSDAVMPSARSG